jgi:3-oxoadipate enol-lactonase/4-carboxymuconolactone decarboxylase
MSTPELHHVVEGRSEPTAPVLLLVHPIGADLEVWEPLLPALLPRFRVVRYDQRGHGRTAAAPGPCTVDALAQDALRLLDRLGIERASVCGTSLGGMVGMWLAVHAKSRVDRLGLLCTSARLGPPEAWHERAALVRQRGPAAIAESSVARWFTPGFAARSPALVKRMQEQVTRTSAEGYAACCEALAQWDMRDRLEQIEARTWILAGGEDPSTPPAHAYALGAAIPHARVSVIENAAHLALAEHPARVAQLLLEHLDPAASTATAEGSDRERAIQGERMRRSVVGDAHVDRARAVVNEFTAPFQDFITRYAWGEIWNRPGLSRAERSLITLSVLVTLSRDDELALHLRGALRNGLSIEQIRELFMQLAVYAGVPAANHAFAIAQKVFADLV